MEMLIEQTDFVPCTARRRDGEDKTYGVICSERDNDAREVVDVVDILSPNRDSHFAVHLLDGADEADDVDQDP